MPDASDGQRESWEDARTDAVRFIAAGDFTAAKDRIAANGDGEAVGERDALLGLIEFRIENYSGAADLFASALTEAGENAEWEHMLAVSRANAIAEVVFEGPYFHHFDRD